jgi:WD40 repeat protein
MTTSTPKYWVTWRVEDGTSLLRLSRPNQDDWPGPLAYTPDGRLLVAASSRFDLALLSAETGQHVALLDAGSNVGFHDCRVSNDGRLLAAASDTSIHLWDLDRLKSSLSSMGLDW